MPEYGRTLSLEAVLKMVSYVDSLLREIIEGKKEELLKQRKARNAYADGLGEACDSDLAEWMLGCLFDTEIRELERDINRLELAYSEAVRVGPVSRLSPKLAVWKEALDKAKRAGIEDVAARFMDIRNTNRNQPCPFHQEKTPSFHIYKKNNRFVCFGCGIRGSPIDFVMQINRCAFKEAVYWIASRT